MHHHALNPGQAVESVNFGVIAGGSGATESFVVVEGVAGDGRAFSTFGGLGGNVVKISLAERAVVEPVVTHPAVDHGAFRCGDFQRGMRIQQRHDDREAFVRRADHADAAVGFRDVFDQPVDGVVGVGDVVRAGAVQRTTHGPRHYVITFRTVL